MRKITTPLIQTLIFWFVLCFVMGCSGNAKKNNASDDSANKSKSELVQDSSTEEDTAQNSTAQVDSLTDTSTGADTATAVVDEPETPATPTSGSGTLSSHEVDEDRMAIVLDNIASELEAQKLEYKSELGQDCSGIYHKVKDLIQRRISILGDKTKYIYPEFSTDRNTRQIAYWYHQHNNLHMVKDAMASRNLIRPGSVMFFGRTEEKYANLSADLLSNPDVFQHDKGAGKGKIYHVGVVTNVTKDDQGNVVRYTLMHGRNSKYNASRTDGNWDGPGGYGEAFAKFPFGNWNQQWVAVANIETPK